MEDFLGLFGTLPERKRISDYVILAMAVTASHPSFLCAFAEYMYHHSEEIQQEWTQGAKESVDVPRAKDLKEEDLRDHVPLLMEDLIERLRNEAETRIDNGSAEKHSREHGKQQWSVGYALPDLIWEIYIIRRVVTQRTLARFAEEHPEYSLEERAEADDLIQDFFHRFTCDSVEQFSQEQQRKIEQKNRELAEVNEARIKLTRTVSHELRNILNAFSTSIQLLEEEEDAETRAEMVGLCRRNMSDMTGLLNQLLDYSALVAGREGVKLEQVNLPDVFNEIVTTWQPVAEEHGLTFEEKMDSHLECVNSDRLKLKQIAGNLLSNAIKYRKKGKAGYVGISLSAMNEDYWKMVVADTGVGIAQEDMGTLFQEFNRIRPDAQTTGTGLGLAITKRYVELLGGHIEPFSEAGQGTRFEITFPVRR